MRTTTVGGGTAFVASRFPNLIYNRVFGFGLETEATEADLERMLGLYSREGPFSIQPSPAVRPQRFPEWIRERGLESHFDWIKWVRDTDAPPDAPTDLRIEPAGPERADTVVQIGCATFPDERPVEPWLALTVGRPGWSHYLAWEDENPAAARRRGSRSSVGSTSR